MILECNSLYEVYMHTELDTGIYSIFGADGIEGASLTGDRFLLIAERILDDELALPLNFSINRISVDGSLIEEKRIFISREVYAQHGEHGVDGTRDIQSQLAEAIQLIASPSTFLEGMAQIERLQDKGFIIGSKDQSADIRVSLSEGEIVTVEFLPETDVNYIRFFTERDTLLEE